MADTLNTEPVILSIIAGQKAFDQSMATLQSNMYRDVAKLEKMLNKQMGGAFQSVGQQAEKGMRSANQAATNLTYQINDIGTSLAGGASPFIVMMQQGSQVAQVFQGLRNDGLSMGNALSAAFGQVLNPVSLLSFAVIGLSGLVYQAFTAAEEGAGKAAEEVEKTATAVAKLAAEMSALAPAAAGVIAEFVRMREASENTDLLKTRVEQLTNLSLEKLTGQFADFLKVSQLLQGLGTPQFTNLESINTLRSDLETVALAGGDSTKAFDALIQKLEEVNAQWRNPDITDYIAMLKRLKVTIGDLRAEKLAVRTLEGMTVAQRDMAKAMDEMAKVGEKTLTPMEKLAEAYERANKAANTVDEKIFVTAEYARVKAILDRIEAEKKAKEISEEAAKAFEKGMAGIYKTKDTISELSSLWIDYLTAITNASNGNDAFTATMEALKQAGEAIKGTGTGVIDAITGKATGLYESLSKVGDKTKELIRQKELFRAEAYYDVDHWRVGFGSDTFVDEMGKTRETLKGTVVTLQQAEADLDNRIRGFQSGIMEKIGPSVWNSFNEAQQAALTSVTYNYGHLPDTVAAAIKSGDTGQVAKAIFDLGTDNEGVNAKRRAQEAALFGGAEFEAPKKAAESYKEWKTAIEAKTEAQRKENAVNADSTTSAYQKIFLIEKEKAVQEGLDAAKRSGLEVTAQLRAEIDAQADSAARLAANQKLLDDATEATKKTQAEAAQKAKELADQYNDMASGAISGFINDMRHGVSAGEAFSKMVDTLIGQLIEMAVKAMVLKSGLGTALSGLFPVALGGGRVGGGGMSNAKVSQAAFVGAPSYARGGMVGLSPGAVPIVAHQGEIIVPTSALRRQATQTRKMGGGGGDSITVGPTSIKMDISNGGGTSATQSSALEFSQIVDRTVQSIIVRESRPGGLLRREQGAR